MMKSAMFKKSLVAVAFTLGAAVSAPVLAQSNPPVVCPGYEKGTTNLVGGCTLRHVGTSASQ